MAASTPDSSQDDVLGTVLAAAQRAPLVPLTDEEQELLAEVEGRPVRWIPHQAFVSKLRPGDHRE
jgi:hypothetical protein